MMKKRVIALVLVVVLVASFVPVGALAEGSRLTHTEVIMEDGDAHIRYYYSAGGRVVASDEMWVPNATMSTEYAANWHIGLDLVFPDYRTFFTSDTSVVYSFEGASVTVYRDASFTELQKQERADMGWFYDLHIDSPGIYLVIVHGEAAFYLVLGSGSSTPPPPPPAITVLMEGIPLTFDVPPQVVNGRTMVPMRAIFEELGAEIVWDGASSTATATKGDTTFVLPIGSSTATVNGVSRALDQPAVTLSGRTLVPLQFVGEALGVAVRWDGATQTVSITS